MGLLAAHLERATCAKKSNFSASDRPVSGSIKFTKKIPIILGILLKQSLRLCGKFKRNRGKGGT